MGIFDKARDALHEHAGTIDPLVDRLADEADRRTGGTHRTHIDRRVGLTEDTLSDPARRDTTPEPGQPG